MPNSKDFNHFDYNPTDINIERSMFNMDHSVKFSCNVGDVIPFDVMEVLPGDTWSVDTSKVVRLQPLVTPIMDEVIMDIYWFFCPNRLVWNKWKEFCGENNQSPWAPQVEYSIPRITAPRNDQDVQVGFEAGTIADYMGIPINSGTAGGVNALPFRAYALICDQWFRSEAVMNPVNVSVDSENRTGVNTGDQTTDIELGGKPFIACKYFDYFTSALPSPQRGDPASVFPNKVFAPVITNVNSFVKSEYGVDHPYANGNPVYIPNKEAHFSDRLKWSTPTGTASEGIFSEVNGNRYISIGSYNNTSATNTSEMTNQYAILPNNLYARLDLSNFFINDLRTAFAVQRYLEKSARYGGRYTEFIKGFFGIDSPDARLQRTEYLGGSRISLNINSVEQTSATVSGSTPQGNVAGMSVTADMNSDFSYSATEHGYIIGCSVLRYHHSYQQGLNRMWLRDSFEEFYLPTFAFLGEQPIYKEELFCNIDISERKKNVFGYQERWAEYRYLPNRVAGEMRSTASPSLDVWHLGDYYSSAPTLSPEWLREDKTMLDRCLAVTSEVSNQAICDFYVKCNVARALPLYSIPGLIDHY